MESGFSNEFDEAIGGYFGLELPAGNSSKIISRFCGEEAIAVNSASHALELLLHIYDKAGKPINRVYLPFYTCENVLEHLRRLDISPVYFDVNDNFLPVELPSPADDELVIINNYFGLFSSQIEQTISKAPHQERFIIDNAQAWWAPVPAMAASIKSPRKFFGLPDGGILTLPSVFRNNLRSFRDNLRDVEASDTASRVYSGLEQDSSVDRASFLLLRTDHGAEAGYNAFRESSRELHNSPVRQMSNLTRAILGSIDYETIAARRRENFYTLDRALNKLNGFPLYGMEDTATVPMVYPLLLDDAEQADALRKHLISQRIFVATYWPDLRTRFGEDSKAWNIARRLLPLPIDQRYGEPQMNRILSSYYRKDHISYI